MGDTVILLIVAVVASVAVVLAVAAIVGRRSSVAADGPDSQFAASTEGMKVCGACGMGNLWTETTCSACGARLRG